MTDSQSPALHYNVVFRVAVRCRGSSVGRALDCGSIGQGFEPLPRYSARGGSPAGSAFLGEISMSLVQPRLTRGLRDLLPEDTLARQAMIDVVRGVYELYGFVPLTTPAIEYLDVLSGSGGQEIQESIFLVQNPEEEQLGLRFDHTVPLARVIAQYRDLPRPFRRYTIGPVSRAD